MQYSTQQIMTFAPQPVRACLALILAILLAACTQGAEETGKENASVEAADSALTLTQWLDEQYETELQFSPIELTFLGRKERNDEIDAFTYAAFAEQLAWKTASVEQMQQLFDRATDRRRAVVIRFVGLSAGANARVRTIFLRRTCV